MRKQSHSNEHFWTVLYNDDCGTYLRDETEMKFLICNVILTDMPEGTHKTATITHLVGFKLNYKII